MPVPSFERVRYLLKEIINSRTDGTDITSSHTGKLPDRLSGPIYFLQGTLHKRDVGGEI